MKNLIVGLIVLAAFLTSCGDMGKKAETKAAEAVKEVKTASTKAYTNIAAGSHLEWRAAHLGGVQPRFGKVSLQSADVKITDGQVTNATVVVDLNTLTVENFEDGSEQQGQLKGHLLNEDFFNVSKYPTATFELTDIAPSSGDYNSTVTGNLTILEATKSITFNANVNTSDSGVSIHSEDFSVDRTDWGLTYNVEGTAGVPANYLIANDIGLTIKVDVK